MHTFSRIQDKINGIPDYFLVGNHRWQFPTFSQNPDRRGNPDLSADNLQEMQIYFYVS